MSGLGRQKFPLAIGRMGCRSCPKAKLLGNMQIGDLQERDLAVLVSSDETNMKARIGGILDGCHTLS